MSKKRRTRMDKPIHLHISYATSDGGGHFSYGSTFVKINRPTTFDEIQRDIQMGLQQKAKFQVPKPTILSIYEMPEELYNMLFPDPPKPRRFVSDMFSVINGVGVADGHIWLSMDQVQPEGMAGPCYPLTEQLKEAKTSDEYIGKKVRITVELIDND